MMRQGIRPAPEVDMTLDEYNAAVKQILAEQQEIATATGQLAMSGQANAANPQFSQIMTKQWSLVQKMLGILTPKK
jgi:hypothetical protein